MGATAFVSLGVGVVTSLAVSGILAGPMLLGCARTPGGLGVCLRTEIARIVPARPGPGVPSSSLSLQPSVSLGGGAAPNQEPPAAAAVSLVAPAGTLSGEGVAASASVAVIALTGGTASVLATDADPQTTSAVGIELSQSPGQVDGSVPAVGEGLATTIALARELGALDVSALSASASVMASVEIVASSADLTAAAEPPSSAPPILAALSAAPGSIDADVTSMPASDAATAVLSAAAGQLDASAPEAVPSLDATAELSPQPGEIAAQGVTSPPAEASAALAPSGVLSPPAPGSSARAADLSVALGAPSLPDPPAIKHLPSADLPKLPLRAAVPAPARIDPRYPNVLVLPLPRGADSSVITLQLD